MNKNIKRYILEIALFLGLLAVDLLTKWLVFDLLKNTGSYVVLDKIFSLNLARNQGASFSIMSGKKAILIALPLIAIIGIVTFLILRPNTPTTLRVGSILIASGALGNLVDRIAFGYVRDFIDYTFLDTFFGIDFAIGNVADLFLLGGVILVIAYIIYEFQDKDLYSKKKLEALENQKENIIQDGN